MAKTSIIFGLLVTLLLLVIWTSLEADAMCPQHYAWRGCQCQCGGERNGHCHCPWGGQIPGVYCRNGGNHWICFPWANGGCPWHRCKENHGYLMKDSSSPLLLVLFPNKE